MARAEEFFTTAEAAELAEAQPGAIEKAIEDGIVEVRKAPAPTAGARPRRLLSAEGVYYVAFLKRCDLHFSKEHKQRLWYGINNGLGLNVLSAQQAVQVVQLHERFPPHPFNLLDDTSPLHPGP